MCLDETAKEHVCVVKAKEGLSKCKRGKIKGKNAEQMHIK